MLTELTRCHRHPIHAQSEVCFILITAGGSVQLPYASCSEAQHKVQARFDEGLKLQCMPVHLQLQMQNRRLGAGSSRNPFGE